MAAPSHTGRSGGRARLPGAETGHRGADPSGVTPQLGRRRDGRTPAFPTDAEPCRAQAAAAAAHRLGGLAPAGTAVAAPRRSARARLRHRLPGRAVVVRPPPRAARPAVPGLAV